MNPNYMKNFPMMMPFNFNNFNPMCNMWNMNPFGQLAQMNIMNQNMNMANLQGGNSKPKSEPITLIFKKIKMDSIFTIGTSSDEPMASVVSNIEKSVDNNFNRFFNNGKIINQALTIKGNGLKNNDLILVVRLTHSELEAL